MGLRLPAGVMERFGNLTQVMVAERCQVLNATEMIHFYLMWISPLKKVALDGKNPEVPFLRGGPTSPSA